LEANKQINVPKNFQSFYFFFRNFFTLGLLVLTLTIVVYIIDLLYQPFHLETVKYIYLIVVSVFVIIVSIIAANWNRKMMVKRMFWTYYSLYKNS